MRIETPEPQVCCKPCSLPKKDLTLTIDGTPTTLAFSSDTNSWSDGTHTLSCGLNVIHLTGGGTWAVSSGTSWTCRPLHLVYTSGASTAYVDE